MPNPLIAEPLQQSQICQNLSNAATDWLVEIEVFESIASTNDRITERLAAGFLDDLDENRGIAATAEYQSAGKGRRGKKWQGQPGLDIALSLSCAVSSPSAAAEGLSLVTGMAVVSALQHFAVEKLSLKWPNDILLDGKKLGGILIELVQQNKRCFAVIGVGVNMGGFADKQASIEQPVADLSSYQISRNALISRLISDIHDFSLNFCSSGFEPFRTSWNALHHYQGQAVILLSASESIFGEVLGIGPKGELLLVDEKGQIQPYVAGELSLRPSI